MRWYRDRVLWLALTVGLLLRVAPLLAWPEDRCVRDECTYIKLALRIASGQGLTSSAGWLWAPGYPYLLAWHKTLFDAASAIKGLQVVAALVSAVLVYVLAVRAFEARENYGSLDTARRTARWAAWLYVLSPHQAFFAGRLWSEVLYATILMGALLLMIAARRAVEEERARAAWGQAALVGALVGGCMLFRGVATYMLPIFGVGLLWRHWRRRVAWGQAAVVVLAAALVVAPYSRYATERYGAFVVTDRTLGQMMWLGNNDFDPVAFDYGNGQLSKRAFARTRETGREPCATRGRAMLRDSCMTAEGLEWIAANPGEFLRRVPMRVAQMLTPHTLLTRHLRWGQYKGLPQWVDELLVLWTVAWSMLVMWVGSFGLAVRGRGGQGVVYAGILLYHVAAIAVLAGLSRYRVPLEPLLMVYAAPVLAEPRETLARLRASRLRMALALVVLGAVVPLVLWYLPAGWPQWRTW